MKPIAIIGRGKSLRRFAQYANQVDKVYLVNPFRHEIDKLGRKWFKGKELVHVVSRGNDCRLSKDHYELFTKVTTIGNATFPYHGATSIFGYWYRGLEPMPEEMKQRGFPLVGWDDVALIMRQMPDIGHDQLIGMLEAGFSDVIHKNNQRATVSTRLWPTTGIFAIDLALIREQAKEVWLFGFDCFQNGKDEYFIGKQNSRQPDDALTAMTYYLRKLVREFLNVQFRSADDLPELRDEPNWSFLEYAEG